ncbi:MAG TPA: IPTL-CTERM sorting domain-containing protein, partial [Tahibacter sp.]|nr:IPTL-CTERM sorting domain-containing protein [Tahibacter sp.]
FGSQAQGRDVGYTIVLTNTGTAQNDNPGDEFTDVLPAGLTLVSATATSGTAVANVGTNTVTWNGAIPAGGSVTIVIGATINPAATGTISNQGTVSFDSDGNGTNDGTAVTDDPAAGGGADATTFSVAGGGPVIIVPVPTLNAWALLLLALGLGGIAWRGRLRVR